MPKDAQSPLVVICGWCKHRVLKASATSSTVRANGQALGYGGNVEMEQLLRARILHLANSSTRH